MTTVYNMTTTPGLTLEITRGIPGSGKTHWAKGVVERDREAGRTTVRVNRDDIRQEIFGKPVLTGEQEQIVTKIQHERIRSLLGAGVNVMVDDTNLNIKRTVKPLQKIAQESGAKFFVYDFDMDVEEAYQNVQKRVAAGGRDVPKHVIQGMFDRYRLAEGFQSIPPLPVEQEVKPYVADTSRPAAWIFDMDGTLTTGPKNRSPYEWLKVGQDEPNKPVIKVLEGLWESPDCAQILIVSGRDSVCREETEKWLRNQGVMYDGLWMRPEGDNRKDSVVKAEIFDRYIRNAFNVLGVFDDRNQVVQFWRSIGLPCFQVQEGNF